MSLENTPQDIAQDCIHDAIESLISARRAIHEVEALLPIPKTKTQSLQQVVEIAMLEKAIGEAIGSLYVISDMKDDDE